MKRIKTTFVLLIYTSVISLFQACSPVPTPTPYIPPAKPVTAIPPPPKEETASPTLIPTIISFASPTSPTPCTNELSFITDLTIPDGTIIQPRDVIQKQWLVENSGTCNWDARYRLRLINGSKMGAKTEQVLYPARAGTQATLSIQFIAPAKPGSHGNAWQAIDPNGEPFGEFISMQIVVQPIAEITIEVVE